MKIQKKNLIKWQIPEPHLDKPIKSTINNRKIHTKSESSNNIFGLPNQILQQPKLSALKMMIKAKQNNYKNFLQNCQTLKSKKQYHSQLRNTIINNAKKQHQSLRKHKSAFQTVNGDEDDYQQINMIKNKKVPISSQHSSQKTLNILHKIIFKDVDFYSKEKAQFQLQANKLPIIISRDSKKKQILAAYEVKSLYQTPSLIKYQTSKIKPNRIQDKRQDSQSYFSAWDVKNDFQ